MYKDDFMISFDQEGPFAAEDYFGYAQQFTDEYALKPQEKIRGKLVFIISFDAKKIMLSYTECFDDESEGKTYKLKYKLQWYFQKIFTKIFLTLHLNKSIIHI